METLKELPILFFATQQEWHDWLAKHYNQTTGIWIKFSRKGATPSSVTYLQALEEALCYGWIDGQAQKYSESHYLQKFTPRRPKSMWSKRNTGFAEKLIQQHRMQPSGLAQIEASKADGRWESAYAGSREMTMPDDFRKLLEANPKAQKFYATLNRTNTYAILWRIQSAKKPETRQTRMQNLLTMLLEGKKIH